MSALTRWVLAHKRTVVISWIVLFIAGVMAAGPATDALDPEFSVPDKEGWETNVEISKHYSGTGGNTVPLVPVVTLPQGKTVDSPGVRADLVRMDRRLEETLPDSRLASYASTGDRTFVSDDGRTTFAVVYPQPDPDSFFGENPRAEKAASAALRDATVGGAPVHLTGIRRFDGGLGRRQRGTGRADRGADRRRRRAPGADLRVRLLPGRDPDRDGDRVDHDHLPAAARY